jgi:predicted component of type VI protein secretion system
MANETDAEIEQAATAQFKKYTERVKDMDDLQGVQLIAQEEMLQQLIRIRLELSALRLSLGGAGAGIGDVGF